MMQPQPSPGPSAGFLAVVVIGTGLLGAICGGFVTYGAMRVGRIAEANRAAPKDSDFGRPEVRTAPGGWWQYTFLDLDMSVELPGTVSPITRSFGSQAFQILDSDDYQGGGGSTGIELGAYWQKGPSEMDPGSVARYNYRGSGSKATFVDTTVDGNPACLILSPASNAEYEGVYVHRGNGLYYLQIRYWLNNKAEGERTWQRILRSIHFLNRKPLVRG